MLIDFDRFTPDETRDHLLLAKELLRNLMSAGYERGTADKIGTAYTVLSEAIRALDSEAERDSSEAQE